MGALATFSGTALTPGVSRNGRFYTPELIGKAVKRASDRIAAGGMPLTMRVSHPKDESHAPVDEIVGQITRMWQEPDGRARFEATMPNTTRARDVLELIDTRGQSPYVRGVSVRGDWVGPVRKVHAPGGRLADTADDLMLDGLDLTHRPGVDDAGVEQVDDPPEQQPQESAGRTRIYESVQEALVTAISEADAAPASKEPYGPVKYADPGYQADKKKRYPIDSLDHAKSAWTFINQADDAKLYTAAQLKRVKARIAAALKKFGVEVNVKESLLIERRVTEAGPMLADAYMPNPAGMEICLDNGMVQVRVCSWRVDPADLDIVARQAMAGACAALALIDPDDDGDIDIPPRPNAADDDGEDEDEDMDEVAPAIAAHVEPVMKALSAALETAPTTAVTEAEHVVPTAAPSADPNTEKEVPAVSEDTTTAAVASSPVAAVPAVTLTAEQFQALLAAAQRPVAAPVEAAPAATVAETAPAPTVTETEDERIARIVNARVTEALQRQVAQNGPPARKGVVGRVAPSGVLETAGNATEGLNSHGLPNDWPDKPLHKFTGDERGLMSAALLEYVTGKR